MTKGPRLSRPAAQVRHRRADRVRRLARAAARRPHLQRDRHPRLGPADVHLQQA